MKPGPLFSTVIPPKKLLNTEPVLIKGLDMNIAVPKSDLEKIGSASIRIPETDNMYFAGLGVFHELHCLKRLRQYTWKDYYFPDISEEDERLNRLHTGRASPSPSLAMFPFSDHVTVS